MTTDQILEEINRLAKPGDFEIEFSHRESIRSKNGDCPICWLDRKLNNYCGNGKTLTHTKLAKDNIDAVVEIATAADGYDTCNKDIKSRLKKVCKI